MRQTQAHESGTSEIESAGVFAPAPEKFDVASVKLNKSTVRQPGQFKAVPASGRLTITNMLVRFVIQGAYGLQSYQLVVADKSPVLAQKIDIEAKTERPVTSGTQLQQMLQPLLAERFKLTIHQEPREMNALVLTLASDGRLGPKIKKSDRDCEHLGTAVTAFVLTRPPADGQRPACGYISSGVGRI